MHWVMLSERTHEDELSIDGTPPLIEQEDWRFDCGVAQPSALPVIDVPFEACEGLRIGDNVPAYGCRGLLVNGRLKAVFEALGLDNVHYHAARLVEQGSGQVFAPYWIANVIGAVACVDHARSELDFHQDGGIRYIDSLALRTDAGLPRMFRLAEFLPLIIVGDEVRQMLVAHRITGFAFYRPGEFSL
jgi:hypothetical protein